MDKKSRDRITINQQIAAFFTAGKTINHIPPGVGKATPKMVDKGKSRYVYADKNDRGSM